MTTQKIAALLRLKAIEMSLNAKASHLASSLSCIDILTVLYEKILKINPKKPRDQNRDRFILSKGHAATSLYTILAHKGFFNKNYLKTYGQKGSLLGEHPTPKLSGVEAATGSLGHGLPIGCGLALSAKISSKNFKTIVLMGDGECNEGTVWESALFASSKNLNNLLAIVDFNNWQGIGRTKDITKLNPFKKKWESFGWKVIEIDGHNHKMIEKSFKMKKINKPILIIARTVKGKGVSFMEDDNNWHYRVPTKKELLLAKTELGLD